MSDIAEPLAHTPARGWTPELKARFLDRLASHGNARAACRNVGLSAEAAYRLRRRDMLFARGWAAALVLARENGQQVLGERAIEGVEEQIYYRGELVGTRRRFDSRLLLAHLARLDKLANDRATDEDAGQFDALLACVIEECEDGPLPEREEFVATAADQAADSFRTEAMGDHDDEKSCHDGWDFDLGDPEDEDAYDEDGYLDNAEAIEHECSKVAERARIEAGEEWDRRNRNASLALEALDALYATPDQPDPATLAAALAAACRKPAEEPAIGHALSFPRTLSTVSTCALSRALADGPGPDEFVISHSPQDAPRVIGRRNRSLPRPSIPQGHMRG